MLGAYRPGAAGLRGARLCNKAPEGGSQQAALRPPARRPASRQPAPAPPRPTPTEAARGGVRGSPSILPGRPAPSSPALAAVTISPAGGVRPCSPGRGAGRCCGASAGGVEGWEWRGTKRPSNAFCKVLLTQLNTDTKHPPDRRRQSVFLCRLQPQLTQMALVPPPRVLPQSGSFSSLLWVRLFSPFPPPPPYF